METYDPNQVVAVMKDSQGNETIIQGINKIPTIKPKNPRNRNHKQKRVVSKSKFQRILKKNLDCTGYAYITIPCDRYDGHYIVKQSYSAVRAGNFVYCKFLCKGSGEDFYYIRYSLNPNDSCDCIAFQYYSSMQKTIMEILNNAE